MRRTVLSLIFITLSLSLYAQYFTTGSSDVKCRWNQLKSSDKRLVYPDFFAPKASLIEGYLNFANPYITTGLMPKIDKIPVIIYPEKVQSNGLVTWTPKRMELYTTPAIEGYSLPWLKQLSVHEYRHVVQLSNLNRGVVKAVGYIIGEHAVGAAAALVPKWFYEGDATLAETQLAIWGRGKQPQFSIGVRALLGDAPQRWSYERWRVGSMKYEYPSIYELGYFSVWAGQTFYSPTIWAEMMEYCGNNPIFAIFNSYNIKRKYGANREVVANRAVEELNYFWRDSWDQDNSTSFIPKSYKWYEKFQNPIMLDNTTIFAERVNKSSVNSFVATDIKSGKSQILDNSVYINSRAEIVGDNIYWSEYKPSLFWETKSYSLIHSAKIEKREDGGKFRLKERRVVHANGDKNIYFVTNMDGKRFAYINFDELNNPEIVVTDSDFQAHSRHKLQGYDVTVNGMAYDTLTERLYLSIVDQNGVNLISYNPKDNSIAKIKKSSHITITSLRADNGKLFYNSSASGKDEIHLLDLTNNKEYQLTDSKYGSFDSSLPYIDDKGDTTITSTTYKFDGYALATQKIDINDNNLIETGYLPNDKLVPKWYDWGAPKIDTLSIAPLTEEALKSREKRYKKLPHSFAPHSWIPLAINLDQLIDEKTLEVGVGATVMSQNLLGGVVSSIGYGYVTSTRMSMGIASIDLTTLPVHFGINAKYGGDYQTVYLMNDNSNSGENGEFNYTPTNFKPYASVSLTASLPMNLSDGRRARYISPYVAYSYTNSKIIEEKGDIINGMDKLSMGVEFKNYKYMAERDLTSPLGYTVSLSSAIDPTSSSFGELYSVYGRGVVPGIAQNHIIELKGNVQYQNYSSYNFIQKPLYPSGCNNNIAFNHLYAATAAYKFPLAFPDWGIKDFIFFRRISMSMFAEYAHGDFTALSNRYEVNPYTYGGEIMFDYNLLGAGSQFYTGISIYKPSERDNVMVGFSFNFNL